jgi:hypothetical protein
VVRILGHGALLIFSNDGAARSGAVINRNSSIAGLIREQAL